MCLLRFVRADEINYLYNFVFRDYLAFRSFEKNSSLVIILRAYTTLKIANLEGGDAKKPRRGKKVFDRLDR